MKKINPTLITTIYNSDTNIIAEDMIGYLICIYHNIYPTYLPLSEIQKEAVRLGLIEIKTDLPVFLIPLYNNEKTDDKWKWVEDKYIPLFKDVKKDNPIREVLPRMKKFFSKNIDIRIDEVIGASKMYIKETNYKYIRESRYFIYKGVGANQISDLLTYVEKYRKAENPITKDKDLSRILQ